MNQFLLVTIAFLATFTSASLAQVTVGQINVNEVANDLMLHSDGTFIISGAEGKDGALYKVTCDGRVLAKLSKTYTPGPTSFYKAVELPDSSIVAVGETKILMEDSSMMLVLLLIKTSSNLQEISSKTLLINNKWGRGRSIALAPDGNLLVLGDTEGAGLDFFHAFLLSVNANTLEASSNPVIYSYGLDHAHSIVSVDSARYLVSIFALIGNIFSEDAPIKNRLITLEVNALGEKQWEYIYEITRLGRYGFCQAGGVARSTGPAQDNIVMAGAIHNPNSLDSLTDAVFILLSLSGEPLDTLFVPLPARQELANLLALEAQPGFFLGVGRTVPLPGSPATAFSAGVVVVNSQLYPVFTLNETTLPINLHDLVEVPYGRLAFLGTFPEFFFLPTRDIILITPGVDDVKLQYQNCALTASFSVPDPQYQWYRDSVPIAGATQGTYKPTGAGRYFVKITDAYGCSGFSDTLYIPWPKANFTWMANGGTVIFENLSSDASTYVWDFGDGATSTDKDPTHSYNDGTYAVRLIAQGPCSADTLTRTLTIVTPPRADFSVVPTIGCPLQNIQIANLSSTNATSFRWFFPGGTPASSTEKNPTVSYGSPGTYSVTLIASNSAGSDTMVRADVVSILPRPIAAFQASAVGVDVYITNLSTGATQFFWEFGDGTTSTLPAPTHTYAASGQYVITLIATGACGSDTVEQVLGVVHALEAEQAPFFVRLTPNPNSGTFVLTLEGNIFDESEIMYTLLSADGRLLDQQTLWATQGALQRIFTYPYLTPGLYTVLIQGKNVLRTVRLFVK